MFGVWRCYFGRESRISSWNARMLGSRSQFGTSCIGWGDDATDIFGRVWSRLFRSSSICVASSSPTTIKFHFYLFISKWRIANMLHNFKTISGSRWKFNFLFDPIRPWIKTVVWTLFKFKRIPKASRRHKLTFPTWPTKQHQTITHQEADRWNLQSQQDSLISFNRFDTPFLM